MKSVQVYYQQRSIVLYKRMTTVASTNVQFTMDQNLILHDVAK